MTRLVSFVLVVLFWMGPNQLIGQQQKKPADQFHDLFMDAIKHKSMGNHDKAIEALQECEVIAPNDYTVYYELGRNYYFQKKYFEASEALKKAFSLNTSNSWINKTLYKVYVAEGNYAEAINIAQELAKISLKYEEELVGLYMSTGESKKAIELIEKLDKERGYSQQREQYKEQFSYLEDGSKAEVKNLNKEISKRPQEVSNYLRLIETYQKKKDFIKAKATASELLDESSNLLEDIQSEIQAIEEDASKQEILCLLAKEYSERHQLDHAIRVLKTSIKINDFHFESHLLYLEAMSKANQFSEVNAEALELIDVFPLQPELYYYLGFAKNQLGQYKKAKTVLEEGLDFVVNKKDLEIRILQELKRSCEMQGLEKEANKYNLRIETLGGVQ